MRQIDENIKNILAKPQTWFVKYFPKRIKNLNDEQQANRQLVYDFKDGKASAQVAEQTAKHLIATYGEDCKNIVFAPIPASSAEKNEIRYKDFCNIVCNLTGAINGYNHIKVSGERLSIHENRKAEKSIRESNIIDFDEDFFNGKQVLVFDDVITKGISYATYAKQIEDLGANVLGGVFLARTHYKVN